MKEENQKKVEQKKEVISEKDTICFAWYREAVSSHSDNSYKIESGNFDNPVVDFVSKRFMQIHEPKANDARERFVIISMPFWLFKRLHFHALCDYRLFSKDYIYEDPEKSYQKPDFKF